MPRLLLFDIDGTLVKSCHKDSLYGGHSLLEALSIPFIQTIHENGIVFAGGTDRSIIRDVLRANGITQENDLQFQEKCNKAIEILPDILSRGLKREVYNWQSLKNVNNLLNNLHYRDDVQLALLTGNIWQAAELKLQSAEIDTSLFHVKSDLDMPKLLGAFGSDHEDRGKLVKIAKHRYEQLIRKNIDYNDIIVIGDTPKDIECAHANNVACVAVATGRYTMQDLKNAEIVLSDFSDTEKCIQFFLETKFTAK